jgi:endonuclease III
MHTSRISKEATRIISATKPSENPKRITRSSLARFAANGSPVGKQEVNKDESEAPTDIEDAISGARKRKRTVSETPVKRSSQRAVKIKTEVEETRTVSPPPSKDRKVRKPARQVKNEDTGEVQIHPPTDWEKIYAVVKEMRVNGAASNAAVDTMGCECLAEETANPRDKRYQTLTALMLSSQTKDTTTALAMKRLQSEVPPHRPGAPLGLNLNNILAIEPSKLNELIHAVGFHNNKTKYIKSTALILRDKFNSDIPNTIEGMTSLPGVGPKMAYLCMSSAWGRDEGIGVDVHVHRITNLWGWHGGAGTKGPEETRIALQKWLPRELWHEINWLLVGFGQTVCLPVGRKCGECELGLQGLCKSAERGKVIAGRRLKEERIVKDEVGEIVEKEEVVKEELKMGEQLVNAAPDAVVNVEGQEDIVKDEDVVKKEEAVEEEVVKGEDVKEEDVKEEDVREEDVKEEEEVAKEEDVREEDVKEEEEVAKEEDMKEEDMKEEDMKEEFVKEELKFEENLVNAAPGRVVVVKGEEEAVKREGIVKMEEGVKKKEAVVKEELF